MLDYFVISVVHIVATEAQTNYTGMNDLLDCVLE